MHRYCLTIEYDGTPFHGWQRQNTHASVQQCIEEAIASFSGETVNTQAAGRTDAGVHALGQVAHFDLTKQWDPFRVQEALNYHLKAHPISILDVVAVGMDFEARFSALARHYEYRILNRRPRPAVERHHVWHVPKPLDAESMHVAAQLLLGVHDFTTFRSAACESKSPVKSIDRCDVRRELDHIIVNVSARSFLHHQVRSITGSLKMVGEGKWTPQDFGAALDAKQRARCGPQAPASGLYLTHVDY